MESGKFQGLAFSRGSATVPTIVAGEIQSFDENSYDLAIYYPSSRFPLGHEKRFWPDDRFDRDPRSILRDYLFVQGFPQRFSRFTTLGGNTIVSGDTRLWSDGQILRGGYQPRTGAIGQRAAGLRVPSQGNVTATSVRRLTFGLSRTTFVGPNSSPRVIKTGWRCSRTPRKRNPSRGAATVRGAFGLSGSPVWRLGASGMSSRQWTPECSRLVGVITNWNSEDRVLIATSASKLLELSGT